tara:strand:+ start:1662 stop:2267 length:606 start_codon:yes stop_codon:yes gene_type:complete
MSNTGIFTPQDINELTTYGQWQGLSQRGTLELLQTQNANTIQNIEFTNYEGYNVHLLVVNNHIFPAGNQNYGIRFYESGVIESGSVYQEASNEGGFAGSFYDNQSSGTNYIRIDNSGSESLRESWYAYFYNLLDNTKYSYVTYQRIMARYSSGGSYNAGGSYYQFGGAVLPQASVVDKIQVYNSSQTASGGTLSLYGIKEY